jgi:hypothetical protein
LQNTTGMQHSREANGTALFGTRQPSQTWRLCDRPNTMKNSGMTQKSLGEPQMWLVNNHERAGEHFHGGGQSCAFFILARLPSTRQIDMVIVMLITREPHSKKPRPRKLGRNGEGEQDRFRGATPDQGRVKRRALDTRLGQID